MLRFVSWQTYLQCWLVILIIYYSLASLFYFRPELRALVKKLSGAGASGTGPASQSQTISGVHAGTVTLSIELQNRIRAAVMDKLQPEELLFSLRQALSKYQSIKDPEFRLRVNGIIREIMQNELGLDPGPKELDNLWT